MTKRISIQAKPREKITADLVGVEYLISPPKGAFSLALAERAQKSKAEGDSTSIWNDVQSWLKKAVGDKQTKAIQKRLDDDDDDLDIMHIVDLMEQVVEVTTDNPTSSSPD